MAEYLSNGLSILSIESEMIAEDIDFNKKVIDHYSSSKNRGMDFNS